MEFPFDLPPLLGAHPGHDGVWIGCIDEGSFAGQRCRPLCEVFDALGKASAVAQGLRKPVTSGTPHLSGQRIYVLADGNRALGFLKVGAKRLFVAPPPGLASERTGVQDALQEITPLCALDFYVHESCQRSGLGKMIFDFMLESEGVQAWQLAYDRPSPKLIAFLAKHCSLTRFRPQNNNFVVFDEYFEGGMGRARPSRGAVGGRAAAHQEERGEGLGGILPGGGGEYRRRQDVGATRPPSMPPWGTSGPEAALGPLGRAPSHTVVGLGGAQQRALSPRAPYALDGAGAGPFAATTAAAPHQMGHEWSAPGAAASWSAAQQQQQPPPAGLRSGGATQPRAASQPCGGRCPSRNSSNGVLGSSGGGDVAPAGCPSGMGRRTGGPGGGSAGRFASPLSHAGQRMLLH